MIDRKLQEIKHAAFKLSNGEWGVFRVNGYGSACLASYKTKRAAVNQTEKLNELNKQGGQL